MKWRIEQWLLENIEGNGVLLNNIVFRAKSWFYCLTTHNNSPSSNSTNWGEIQVYFLIMFEFFQVPHKIILFKFHGFWSYFNSLSSHFTLFYPIFVFLQWNFNEMLLSLFRKDNKKNERKQLNYNNILYTKYVLCHNVYQIPFNSNTLFLYIE